MFKDKTKQSEFQRQWYQTVVKQRRIDWIAKNGPCRECGSCNNLQVDHIDRTQKVHHAIWSWSKERREKELAKCQVLCFACHVKKTAKELNALYVKKSRLEIRKLSTEQEIKIREQLKRGVTQRELAAIYNIGKTTVFAISRRTS